MGPSLLREDQKPARDPWAVLVVDDDPQILRMVERLLRASFDIVTCESGPEALGQLTNHDVGVMITDQNMPGMSGFELLREVRKHPPEAPMVRIVLSAHGDFQVLEGFVNECRIDHFLSKPFEIAQLRSVMEEAQGQVNAARHAREEKERLAAAEQALAEENQLLRSRIHAMEGFHEMVGDSAALRLVLDRLDLVRASHVTVHVSGETGTGKELAARAIHNGGPRRGKAFVAQNCGGLPDNLLQSTLFGHKKGAFTGAERQHEGVFEQANGGTLFLDEVAELSPTAQASLLRVLEVGEITPLGATATKQVDVRIVSATHKDLREAVDKGRFREDLYYRLVVIGIEMPPLRNRHGDVPLLLAHFLAHHCHKQSKRVPGFTREALEALERYPWPGNVRELSHEVQRLVVMASNEEAIAARALSDRIRSDVQATRPLNVGATTPRFGDVPPAGGTDPDAALADGGHQAHSLEGILIPGGLSYDEARIRLGRTMISQALQETNGVIRKAADKLGMERSRLAKLRRRLGIALDTSQN